MQVAVALGSYADPGPEAELERRVLARIAAEASPRRRRWLPWAIALPAVACPCFSSC